MIDNPEAVETIKEKLMPQKLAVLSTNDEGQPYASLVAFAMANDIKRLLFATERNTRKYRNIMRESRIAMLIDNRSGKESDFENAVAATVIGNAEKAGDEEKTEFLEIFLKKHPTLEKFVTSQTCALFFFNVKKYLLVSNFKDVVELNFE